MACILFVVSVQSATVDIPWGFGSSGTFNVQLGDILSFRWTGSSSHTVAWTAGPFQTSPVSNTLGHTVNYTVGLAQLGDTLNAFCSIHPSMTATINVAGLPSETPTVSPNTAAPTNAPTFKPTRSPLDVSETFVPSASPTAWPTRWPGHNTHSPSSWPTPKPSKSPFTHSPTKSPTVSEGLSTEATVGFAVGGVL